jgi:hypothetical protein
MRGSKEVIRNTVVEHLMFGIRGVLPAEIIYFQGIPSMVVITALLGYGVVKPKAESMQRGVTKTGKSMCLSPGSKRVQNQRPGNKTVLIMIFSLFSFFIVMFNRFFEFAHELLFCMNNCHFCIFGI